MKKILVCILLLPSVVFGIEQRLSNQTLQTTDSPMFSNTTITYNITAGSATIPTFIGKMSNSYVEQETADDGTRYLSYAVTADSSATSGTGAAVTGIYGAYNWTAGDNSSYSAAAIEGVARSQGADEDLTLRGIYGRFYIDPTDPLSTLRTGIGGEFSARAGYGGAEITAESGTCFAGARIWMAPYFTAISTANINNFHGLWIYNEHPTISVTDGIFISNAASGGFNYGLNLNGANINDADIKLHNGATLNEGVAGTITSSANIAAPNLTATYGVSAATGVITGSSFSVGGSTFCTQQGRVGIGTNNPMGFGAGTAKLTIFGASDAILLNMTDNVSTSLTLKVGSSGVQYVSDQTTNHVFADGTNVNFTVGPSSATCNDNMVVLGAVCFAQKTTAQLVVITPTALGQTYWNTNTNELWISTGTAVNQFIHK